MSSSLKYRSDIDGLRAVAVLGVVLFHADLGFPGGYVGVDVFFVISGFLITSLLLKDLRAGSFSLLDFWERRARRILPALTVLVVAVLGAGWFLLLPRDYETLAKQIIALSLFSSNIKFWLESGYFDIVAEEKPLLHTWSLSLEEQFYLLIPLLLMILFRWRKERWVMPVLAVGSVASFVLSIYGSHQFPTPTFYLLPTRAWELAAGALLAYAPSPRSRKARAVAGWIGLACIVIPYFLYTPGLRFPGLSALPPVAGAALLIWAGLRSGDEKLPLPSRVLAFRPLVWIGLLSYSLYLWHWPLFAFQKYLGFHSTSWGIQLGLVSVSFLLAWLSLRFVERPFRSKGFVRDRSAVFMISAGVISMAMLVSISIWINRGAEIRFDPNDQRMIHTAKMNLKYCRNLVVKDVPDNLTRLGKGEDAASVFVWGDSHAMAVMPVIDAVCKDMGVTAKGATHSATAPVLDWFHVLSKHGLGAAAPEYNASVVEFLSKADFSGRPVRLVIAARWSYYLSDAKSRESFSLAMEKTIGDLASKGIEIFILGEVPGFGFNPPRALGVASLTRTSVDHLVSSVAMCQERDRSQKELFDRLKVFNVKIIDPIPYFANSGGVIRPADEQGSLWADPHHLSSYGSLRLKPAFEAAFHGN